MRKHRKCVEILYGVSFSKLNDNYILSFHYRSTLKSTTRYGLTTPRYAHKYIRCVQKQPLFTLVLPAILLPTVAHIFGRRKDGHEKRDFEHTCLQLSENYVAVVDGMAEELRVCADSADQNREMFAGQEINWPRRCTAANIDMTQAAKAAYKHKVLM